MDVVFIAKGKKSTVVEKRCDKVTRMLEVDVVKGVLLTKRTMLDKILLDPLLEFLYHKLNQGEET